MARSKGGVIFLKELLRETIGEKPNQKNDKPKQKQCQHLPEGKESFYDFCRKRFFISNTPHEDTKTHENTVSKQKIKPLALPPEWAFETKVVSVKQYFINA